MRNKLIAIVITIFVMGGLLAAWYLLFYKKSPRDNTAVQTTTPTLTKVSDDEVFSPVVTYDGSGVWYFNSKGHLFRRDISTSESKEYPLANIPDGFRQALWPTKGDDFIFEANNRFYYNTKSGEFKQLPGNIQSLDFMPDGQRIAYVWKAADGKTQSLYIANSDASGYTKVKDVFWPDLTVKVSPDGKSALLIRSFVNDTNKIYKADLSTGEFTTVVEQGRNTEARWITPEKFLYVAVVNGQYDLKIYDLMKNESTDTGISATLDKVAADQDGKYLYVDMKDGDSNSIYKVDLGNMQAQILYHMDTSITPSSLMLDGKIILFINSQDKKLYKLTQ